MSPDDHKVVMRGLAVQPFLSGLLGFLLLPPSESAVVVGVFFAIAGVTITACVAYPLLLWFIRRRELTLIRTLMSGALLGNIPAAVAAAAVMAGGTPAADLDSLMRPATVGTFVGVISAAAFWGISGRYLRRRHPPAVTR